MRNALIIVDVQKDFGEKGGSLYVNNAEEIIPEINVLIAETKSKAGIIVASKDWHPANHMSFKGENPWPAHCVENTPGSEYVDGLAKEKIDFEVLKGFRPDVDSYSAFGGYEFKNGFPLDNLYELLEEEGIDELDVVGLATDYCIKATVLDALNKYNFKVVRVILAGIKAVNIKPEDGANAIKEMKDAGAIIVE